MVGKTIGTPKIFVLDTNVVLHDPRSIFNFQENDIYIPITVIEELDQFKKGNDNLSFNARHFVRALDKVSDNQMFEKGISLGKGKGHIKIEMGHPYTKLMRESLLDDIPDHRIIATAMWLHENNPDRKVILVTKDINMRLKAKALGLMSQDYLTDRIEEKKIIKSEKEVITLKNISSQLIEQLTMGYEISKLNEFNIKKKPAPNQLYKIFGKDNNLILARYDELKKKIVKINAPKSYGILPRNAEQSFALDAVLNPNIKLIALTGRAGTGKTLISFAGALAQADNYDQILLARSVIPLKNQELGLLSGNLSNKIDPYLLPLFDNLSAIKNSFDPNSKEVEKINNMLKSEKLLINPLEYIRGRSLGNVFFIIDESQNLSPHEIKTIITRAGEGTKIVFTGDIYQIDQPYLDINSNGLTYLCDKFKGQSVFEHINLFKGERSELSELADKLL